MYRKKQGIESHIRDSKHKAVSCDYVIVSARFRILIPVGRNGMRRYDNQARSMSATETGGMTVPYRRHVYFACLALALACNYVLGKDIAWDTLNYHLYLGFSALNDRFGQDYFAAGTLSYLNPYAYIPFYAMVRASLPALAICSVFAAVHSIILWLSFELGVAVCPSKDGRTRVFAGSCAAALAFMNPILMQQIGSCFADITTAELALGGWLLLASAVRVPRISRVIYAGLILGAASALKLSNALSAVSAFAMLVMLPLSWRGKVRHGSFYGISLGIGFAVIAAPWSYRLEKIFGNPMFPMFNTVFRSPELPTESTGAAYRFIPESIGEALWRPFAMIGPGQMRHEELSSPDPRYAILVALAILFVLRWVWRRFGQASFPQGNLQFNESARVLGALGCGLVVDWILWLRVSGNSRYVLTMACIAAAVIVGMLFQLFQSRTKVRNYILAIIFVTQAVQLYMGAEYRWNGVPWGGPWFDVSIPQKLKAEPNLYLTLGTQSNSFLAPFVAKESGFINVVGGYSLDPDGANGAHVRELIRRFSPHLRVAFLSARPDENTERRAPPAQVDDALLLYGLRPDWDDCATITVHGLPPALEIRYQTTLPQEPQNRDSTYVATCRLIPDTADRSALMARQRAVNLVFDRLEDACPRLFQPRRMVTVHYEAVWRRIYGATDIVAWISKGRVKFSDQIRPGGVIDVGSESDWAKAPLHLDCGKRNGAYFAHVL
jgi:hypothetical protein